MSSESVGGSAGSKRSPLVITLAAVGAVLLILCVLFLVGVDMGPLTSLFHSGKAAGSGMHGKRAIVAGVLGVAALVGAFFMNKKSAS
jgi:hypothetical protein